MTTINVQFSDNTKSTIVSYFSCPQDPEVWANTGQVDSGSEIWASYYSSIDPRLQRFLPAPTATS